MKRLRKVIRFTRVYGPRRTWYKVQGRTRWPMIPLRLFRRRRVTVAAIGCGQFAYSTIGYFLQQYSNAGFRACYDRNPKAAKSFAQRYGVRLTAATPKEAICAPGVELVYVASNHASHASYACTAARVKKRVYVEKPIAISRDQLRELCAVRRATGAEIFAGYNRPFSSAVRRLRQWCNITESPLTLSCFVSGHHLGPEHWYRNPDEGTRICGNAGHWLDLLVHVLHWGELPDRWRIDLTWSDERSRDDDLAIAMASERGDLATIVMTSRTEPFEGVNETINLQWGEVIAKIDDFRRMTLWKGRRLRHYRYWPKDVGHKRAVLQPFGGWRRDWHEVELSTLLTIRIAEMVAAGERTAEFSFGREWRSLGVDRAGSEAA